MNHLCIFILNLFRALCFASYRHWIATNAATIGTYTNPFAHTHNHVHTNTHTPWFGQPHYTLLMLTQNNLLHLRRPLSLSMPCYSFVYFRRLRITYLNYRDFFFSVLANATFTCTSRLRSNELYVLLAIFRILICLFKYIVTKLLTKKTNRLQATTFEYKTKIISSKYCIWVFFLNFQCDN